jgi:hypothetical protein
MHIEKNTNNPIAACNEKEIGRTLYRITSIYTGRLELKEALEELTVKRILRDENAKGL